MNVGALVIITIPTEVEENNYRIKTNAINITTLKEQEQKILAATTENICNDLQYGTFHKSMINSKHPQPINNNNNYNNKNVKININFKGNENDNDDLITKEDPIRKPWDGIKDIITANNNTTNRNTENKKDCVQDLNIPETSSQEVVLKEILKKLKIEHSTWTISNNGKSYQIIFTIKCTEKYELLLLKLNEWGIGDREGSTVSILNCSVFNSFVKDSDINEDFDSNEELNAQKRSAWNKFMNSMTARLNVAQIVRDVRQEAAITFDFIILAVSAAILASFGLVEDSTIFLASSMLISPLMGPIIAAIFGTVIKDYSLRSLGFINELFGISIATFVGFCFGLIICAIDERYGIGEGLTTEILARCELHSVIVGILTAIPSGAAAAVGILGGNIGSLVGVAISASLLPPAVNAGILWALACIYTVYEADGSKYNKIIKTNFYSDNQALELFIYGSISMCVTITNIFCVYIMGILVLKVKEIAPVISRNNRQFWKYDIKIARDFNMNCYSEDSVIANEIAALHKDDQDNLGLRSDIFKSVNIDNAAYQNTWSPMSSRPTYDCRETEAKMQELERIYLTVTRPYTETNNRLRTMAIGRTRTIHKLVNDDLNQFTRRASMPFDVMRSPLQFRTGNFKLEPLEKISELDKSNSDMSKTVKTTNHSKKNRKFIVTPVSSSILDKE